MKKVASLLLALVMVLAMAVPAMAEESVTFTMSVAPSVNRYAVAPLAEGDEQITGGITAAERKYEVYQIFKGDLEPLMVQDKDEDGNLKVDETGTPVMVQATDESGNLLYTTTLSNVVWGKNGTDTEDTPVSKDVLNALEAVNGKSDVEKLDVIKQYVVIDSDKKYAEVSESKPLDNVEPGYYLLKDISDELSNGEEASYFIVKVVGNVVINPKVSSTSSEKKVKDTNDTTGETSGWQDSADHDIGDAVPFQLKATITGNYDHYETYKLVFHDTLSAGLTFNADSVKVYVDGEEITTGYEVVTENLTDGCTFEVVFENLKDVTAVEANSVITVEYTATLNENAVLGSAGNPNKMKLEYSNNPNDATKTGTTPEDTVIVFTYKVVVNKVDANNEPLAGAGFTLYKGKDTTVTNEETNETTTTTEWIPVGEELKGDDLTTFAWTGLDDGNYKLVETTTPVGYNTVADIFFTITAEHEIESDNPALKSLNGGNLFTGEVSTGTLTTEVVNNKGTELPETGGMGTTLIYVVGGMLVLGAVIILISKKRAEAEAAE